MNKLFTHPSFLAHVGNGLLIFIALILVIKNFYVIKNLDPYSMIMLILLASAVVGIHGISHLGLEKEYKFDPINQYVQ